MSKHTPGPWHSDNSAQVVKSADGKNVAAFFWRDENGMGRPFFGHQSQQNMNICCAAPDLLAALKSVVHAAKMGDMHPYLRSCIRDAELEIKKAEGDKS